MILEIKINTKVDRMNFVEVFFFHVISNLILLK